MKKYFLINSYLFPSPFLLEKSLVHSSNSRFGASVVHNDTFPHFPDFLICQKIMSENFNKNFLLYHEIHHL